MRNHLIILEFTLTVLWIYVFIDSIIISKPNLTKSEHFQHFQPFQYFQLFQCKNEITNISNITIYSQGFQQATNSINTNSLTFTSSSFIFSDIEQNHHITITPSYLIKFFQSLHISSQTQHTIFSHGTAKFFSFSSPFNFINFYYSFESTNMTTSSKAILFLILTFFFVFSHFLLFNMNNTFSNQIFQKEQFIHKNHNEEIKLFFIFLFFTHCSQIFDETTRTLIVTNESDFTNASTYANIAEHVVISEGINHIPSNAFYSFSFLLSVLISDTVTSIGDYAFYSCSSLENITIPSSVTSIGDYAFRLCYSLVNITIPSSVTSIGSNPFSSCTSLKFVKVSEGNSNYVSDSNGILYSINFTTIICYPAGKQLTSFIIPITVTSIGNYAFSSCSSLLNITIPNSVTSIGSYSFTSCSALETVTIGINVEIIWDNAFRQCYSLKSITIPNLVTSIAGFTFAMCSALDTVIIGEMVETIQGYAFSSCYSLKCIYFYGETPPTVSSTAFNTVPATTVMTLETYQGDRFGTFNVSIGTTIDECLPPTHTFTESNTFTNTFSESNSFTESNTFTESNSFTESNTFSNTFTGSNTFTESNTFSSTFTGSNSFTESNSFTGSSTFTSSLGSGVSFTNTFTLTHSLSLTQTISICNSTHSISFSVSGIAYIQTEVVYYSYTAVVYSFYLSYYISAFTVYYQSVAASGGSNTTIIIAACSAAAAVVVVALLVVLLIKIRSRKQTSCEQEADNFERNDFESTNSFSGGLTVSNIEEDPFADDFKEDKFIDKI